MNTPSDIKTETQKENENEILVHSPVILNDEDIWDLSADSKSFQSLSQDDNTELELNQFSSSSDPFENALHYHVAPTKQKECIQEKTPTVDPVKIVEVPKIKKTNPIVKKQKPKQKLQEYNENEDYDEDYDEFYDEYDKYNSYYE
jgi:hypothetical protein